MVFSPDFEFIYILIIADELDLRRQAERSGFLTAVDWERADPEAFEPVDERYVALIDKYREDNDIEILGYYQLFVDALMREKEGRVGPEVLKYHVEKA